MNTINLEKYVIGSAALDGGCRELTIAWLPRCTGKPGDGDTRAAVIAAAIERGFRGTKHLETLSWSIDGGWLYLLESCDPCS